MDAVTLQTRMEALEANLEAGNKGRLQAAHALVISGDWKKRVAYYKTTLTDCQCPDFQNRKPKRCKHILAVALMEGVSSTAAAEPFVIKDNAGLDSLLRSVVIKAIRVGWKDGIVRPHFVLGDVAIKQLLWRQVWEDLIPSIEDLPFIADCIANLDLDGYLSIETAHGQWHDGKSVMEITKPYYSPIPFPAEQVNRFIKDIEPRAYFTPKVYPNAAAWMAIGGGIRGRRSVDLTPWKGIPISMYDGHTVISGRRGPETWLSGTWTGALGLADMVYRGGWLSVRERLHRENVIASDLDDDRVFSVKIEPAKPKEEGPKPKDEQPKLPGME